MNAAWSAQVDRSLPSSRRIGWLCRRRRLVLGTVWIDGTQLDAFQASRRETLVSTVRPVLRHLPEGAEMRLIGVEEEWLPLGAGRSRHERGLQSLGAAVSFLES